MPSWEPFTTPKRPNETPTTSRPGSRSASRLGSPISRDAPVSLTDATRQLRETMAASKPDAADHEFVLEGAPRGRARTISSGSTAEKVRLWEERSRSRSRTETRRESVVPRPRSRSFSTGRAAAVAEDDWKHRVSVVPEVPEMPAGLDLGKVSFEFVAAGEEKQKMAGEEVKDDRDQNVAVEESRPVQVQESRDSLESLGPTDDLGSSQNPGDVGNFETNTEPTEATLPSDRTDDDAQLDSGLEDNTTQFATPVSQVFEIQRDDAEDREYQGETAGFALPGEVNEDALEINRQDEDPGPHTQKSPNSDHYQDIPANQAGPITEPQSANVSNDSTPRDLPAPTPRKPRDNAAELASHRDTLLEPMTRAGLRDSAFFSADDDGDGMFDKGYEDEEDGMPTPRLASPVTAAAYRDERDEGTEIKRDISKVNQVANLRERTEREDGDGVCEETMPLADEPIVEESVLTEDTAIVEPDHSKHQEDGASDNGEVTTDRPQTPEPDYLEVHSNTPVEPEEQDVASTDDEMEEEPQMLQRPLTPPSRQSVSPPILPTPEASPESIKSRPITAQEESSLSLDESLGSENETETETELSSMTAPSTPPRSVLANTMPPTPEETPKISAATRVTTAPAAREEKHVEEEEEWEVVHRTETPVIERILTDLGAGKLAEEEHTREVPVPRRDSSDDLEESSRGRRRTRDLDTEAREAKTKLAPVQEPEPTLRDHVVDSQADLDQPFSYQFPNIPLQARGSDFVAHGSHLQPPRAPSRARLSPTAAPFEPQPHQKTPFEVDLEMGNVPAPPPGPPRAYSTTRQRNGQSRGSRGSRGRRPDPNRKPWDAPPILERAMHAASVGLIQGFSLFPMGAYRGLRDYYYPRPGRPDVVKAYEIRRRLSVRVFFPRSADTLSAALYPTLFTLHGSGFTLGRPIDDDGWNRSFADAHGILVVALNYSKAPWAAFPRPLLDVEVLYHAVLQDESLPIDRNRTALLGFDAGANLMLALAQLPSVQSGQSPFDIPGPRHHGLLPRFTTRHVQQSFPPPRAVVPVCGLLDLSEPPAHKAAARPYKRQLPGLRGWRYDWQLTPGMLPSSGWSYVPLGADVADPLLSPVWAPRNNLPDHVFVIGAELDCLARESWRAACAWAGRTVPPRQVVVGRPDPAPRWLRGALDDGRTGGDTGDRFSFSGPGIVRPGDGSRGSTRWLLVPDVMHGFDCQGWRDRFLWGDEEARMDAEMKTYAYQREVAEWLWETVWKGLGPGREGRTGYVDGVVYA